jgi:hypothetical protein
MVCVARAMLVCALAAQLGVAREVSTWSVVADFERTATSGGTAERTAGSIFFRSSGLIVVKVSDPVGQTVVLEGASMVVYYPVSGTAFRFTGGRPLSLPFAHVFLGAAAGDLGLAATGVALGRHEMNGDTLLTYWSPPDHASEAVGEILLGHTQNRLVSVETRSPEGESVERVVCGGHVEHEGAFYPTEITIRSSEKGHIVSEAVEYSGLRFDVRLAQGIEGFPLPDSVKVQEVEW